MKSTLYNQYSFTISVKILKIIEKEGIELTKIVHLAYIFQLMDCNHFYTLGMDGIT